MTVNAKADLTPDQSRQDKAGILRTGEARATNTAPIRALSEELGPGPFSLITLFVTPYADFAEVMREAKVVYPETDVVACTTAGELGAGGYEENTIVGVGFTTEDFVTTSLLIEDINTLDVQATIARITLQRMSLLEQTPDFEHSFAFLVVDGLSLSEDTLTATISPALRNFPVFGGSAGDGTAFQRTLVGLNEHVADKSAVLTLARSRHRTHVFSLNHLIPGEVQMVVTEADPSRRIVKEINAEPAAREYARLVGKDPDQLDRFTFASHPIVVRIGDTHHVRAIQQVSDAGELVFFSAIDEGMVLTVAKPQNLAEHLAKNLAELSAVEAPENIIGFDCILRRIEAEQSQQARQISSVLSDNRVIGFSTYGEQIGPLHVNHTMSGIAFYRSAKTIGVRT